MNSLRSRSFRFGLIALASVLIAAVCLYIFRTRHDGLSLPKILGTMELKKEIRGDEASRIVNAMHGKGVTPADNLIGIYAKSGARTTVYLSAFDKRKDAEVVLRRMIGGIERGDTPFSSLEQKNVGRTNVASCTGLGEVHYFFAANNELYWLASDIQLSERSLAEFIATLSN